MAASSLASLAAVESALKDSEYGKPLLPSLATFESALNDGNDSPRFAKPSVVGGAPATVRFLATEPPSIPE